MTAKFGPAGASTSFYEAKNKSTNQMPAFLKERSLTAFEYQCGRGVNIGDEKCKQLAPIFKQYDIALSLHAPYYINMASQEAEKRQNSINYIIQSANAANLMGATRVIFHPGSIGKVDRAEALQQALKTLKLALNELDASGLGHIILCPETMGKIAQLGDLNEVLQLCKIDERLIPCIDFGHLNARTGGGVDSKDAYFKILDSIKNEVGEQRYKIFHSHFSKIEYTKGGEKKHLTFEDEVYGPKFEPLADLIAELDIAPTFICESDGTQTEDSMAMKLLYEEAKL